MKTNNKEIPFGYKDSPLGVIPEGWQVKRLGEIAEISSGGTPLREKPEYWNGNIPWVTTSLINQSAINYADEYITEQGLNNSAAKILEKGTLLMAMYGQGLTRGKISKLNISAATNQACAALKINRGHADYIFYALDYGYEDIRALSNDGGQKNLSLGLIKEIKIILPSLGEQERIAEILGTWDRAIELQGQKVALLQSRKRALMQQLLTPHRRLPNFSEPWKTTKLGEIAERVTRKNTENNLNVMTISAQRGFVSQTDFFNKSIASEITDNYFLVHQDEFCYNKSYCNGYPMGAIKRLNNAEKAVVTTLYICFRIKCDKCDIEFLEQYFEAGFLNKNLMKIANEGGRAHGLLNVTPSDFFAMSFEVPSLDEQRAIAEVLTTADREIELATQNLTALRSQKRALMQQLLTGKKRLKYDI